MKEKKRLHFPTDLGRPVDPFSGTPTFEKVYMRFLENEKRIKRLEDDFMALRARMGKLK